VSLCSTPIGSVGISELPPSETTVSTSGNFLSVFSTMIWVAMASEEKALSFIKARIAKGTVVHADESPNWNESHSRYEMKRINHEEAYSLDGACTNWAEEFFSSMRRAEIGHHDHVAGPYLLRFAQEASWREDNRRLSNGEQVSRIAGLAMASKRSVDLTGYWQRHIRAESKPTA
jgi:hypothetical protein